MPLLARQAQLAARPDVLPLAHALSPRVLLQRIFKLTDPLGPPVRQHVHARESRRREEPGAYLAHARNDLLDVGKAVHGVTRRLFALATRGVRGKLVGQARELVEAHVDRAPVGKTRTVLTVVSTPDV